MTLFPKKNYGLRRSKAHQKVWHIDFLNKGDELTWKIREKIEFKDIHDQRGVPK